MAKNRRVVIIGLLVLTLVLAGVSIFIGLQVGQEQAPEDSDALVNNACNELEKGCGGNKISRIFASESNGVKINNQVIGQTDCDSVDIGDGSLDVSIDIDYTSDAGTAISIQNVGIGLYGPRTNYTCTRGQFTTAINSPEIGVFGKQTLNIPASGNFSITRTASIPITECGWYQVDIITGSCGTTACDPGGRVFEVTGCDDVEEETPVCGEACTGSGQGNCESGNTCSAGKCVKTTCFNAPGTCNSDGCTPKINECGGDCTTSEGCTSGNVCSGGKCVDEECLVNGNCGVDQCTPTVEVNECGEACSGTGQGTCSSGNTCSNNTCVLNTCLVAGNCTSDGCTPSKPNEPLFNIVKTAARVCDATTGDFTVTYSITVTNISNVSGTIDNVVDTYDTKIDTNLLVISGISPTTGVKAGGKITWTGTEAERTYTANQSKTFTYKLTIPNNKVSAFTAGINNTVLVQFDTPTKQDNQVTFSLNTPADCTTIPATGLFDGDSNYLILGLALLTTALLAYRLKLGGNLLARYKFRFVTPSKYQDKVLIRLGESKKKK